jgi:ankyrin repeat protein
MSKTLIELWDDFFDDNNELKEQYILNDPSSCKSEFHSFLKENSLQFDNIPEKNHLLQEKSFENYVKILVFLEKNLNEELPSLIKSKAFALTMIFNNLDELKGYFNRYYEEPKKKQTEHLSKATDIPIINEKTYFNSCNVELWRKILNKKKDINSENSIYFRFIPLASLIENFAKHQNTNLEKANLTQLYQYASDVYYLNNDKPLGSSEERLLFFRNNVEYRGLEDWLSLKKIAKNNDTLVPAVNINLAIINEKYRNYRLRKLDAQDPLNALIGLYTGCCHAINDDAGGNYLTMNVCKDSSAGTYVIFNDKGTPVAKTIAYRSNDNAIIFNQVQVNFIEKNRANDFYEKTFAYLACYLHLHENIDKIAQSNTGLIIGHEGESHTITSQNGTYYFDSERDRKILINNRTWLHLAITYDIMHLFTDELNQKQESIHQKNSLGQSPLHIAASLGKADMANTLLTLKADISAKDDQGQTPLHLAAQQGHFNILELLISKNADMFAKDHQGQTPLHLAAAAGHFNIVILLISKGADIITMDSSENNITPLELLLVQEKLTEKVFENIFTPEIIDKSKKFISDKSFLNKIRLLNEAVIELTDNHFILNVISNWIDIHHLVNEKGKTLGHLCFESSVLSDFLIRYHPKLFNRKDFAEKTPLDDYLQFNVNEIKFPFLEKLINITEYIDTNRLIASLTKYLDDIKSRYYKDSNDIDTLNRLIERFSLLHKPEQATSHSLLHQHSIFQPTSHDRKEIISEEAHEEGHAPKNN